MELDPENKLTEKDIEIDKLFKILDIIIGLLGSEKSNKIKYELGRFLVNIDVSDKLAGLLMTVFTCLRKEQNDPTGFNRYKAYSAKVLGIEITVNNVVEEVKKQKIELNFLIATPIVELITLFNSCFDEVRTGVTRFKVREDVAKRSMKRDSSGEVIGRQHKSREMTQNIFQYGLNFHHIPLLQGITFAPERRTGVIRSLGPMAQAIMLVMEDNDYNKIQSAMSNSLQMLPMAAEIISCLKEARNPGNVAGILKELGDLLILTASRSSRKFYFPLTLYWIMWLHKGNSGSWSFSGSAMMKAYTEIVLNKGLTFEIKSRGDTTKTAQVIFHSMFGTYLDDLEICSQITLNTGKWFQRKDMNNVFLKRGDAPTVSFKPICFKYVWKTAQALHTKSLGNVNALPTSRPSFSGFRKRSFGQNFLNYLRTGKASHTFSNDPIQLHYALRKAKDQVMEDIEHVKLLRVGTVSWEMMKNEVWVPCDFEAVEGSSRFFGV